MFGKARLSKPLEIIPWQSLGDLSKYGLTLEDVSQRVYFVEANKVPIGGPRAIFKAGECMKKPWRYLAKLLLIPGVSIISEPIYRWVAKNRDKMPGGTQACAIDKPTKARKRILGLNVFVGRNIEEQLGKYANTLVNKPLSYDEVGATKGKFPDGYTIDKYKIDLGTGKDVFDKAVKGFNIGVSHSGANLMIAPKEFAFVKGSSVLFGFRLGPFTLGILDRIVYMNQTENYFECAYGTVQGHPEKGEELFKITLQDNGQVVYEIICFSKIVAPLARLGYPVSRFLQKSMTRKYLTSLKEYVEQND